MYSSPPIHGSSIVRTVLTDEQLTKQYYEECAFMANRIGSMRKLLVDELKKAGSTHDWSHITSQIGMFAYTGKLILDGFYWILYYLCISDESLTLFHLYLTHCRNEQWHVWWAHIRVFYFPYTWWTYQSCWAQWEQCCLRSKGNTCSYRWKANYHWGINEWMLGRIMNIQRWKRHICSIIITYLF